MNHPKESCSNPACSSGNLRELIFNKEFDFSEVSGLCESCFAEYCLTQESIVSLFRKSSEKYLDELVAGEGVSEIQGALDFQRAGEMTPNFELPLYLQKYVAYGLANTEKKETGSLIVKIGQNGIKILNSLLDNFFPIPLEISSPSMRSLNPLTGASITLQESLAESAKISYQLIKESPDTVFLTIQMNFLKIGHDYYVNLRKDDRFIISARVNSEGVVNFPGLLEGRYNIEFVGENFSKSFDVTIVTD